MYIFNIYIYTIYNMYIEILEQRVEAHIKIPQMVPLNLG